MADASRDPMSSSWGDAFAALPLESPPASRWPQLAAQLAARLDAAAKPARTHRRWLALAAGLCALAALPLAWTLRDAVNNRDAPDDNTAPVAMAVPRMAPIIEARVEPAAETAIERSANPQTSIAARTSPPSVLDSARVAPRRERRERGRPAADAATATAIATVEPAAIPADDAPEPTLESLYAASTQLETLLALTRDTRVESGPAAALAGALDAELATIDAQLAQPGLEALQQQALWRARVDTLREATDFETQQRVLSAQGRRYEGALVRVD